jgi:hypothetical protein
VGSGATEAAAQPVLRAHPILFPHQRALQIKLRLPGGVDTGRHERRYDRVLDGTVLMYVEYENERRGRDVVDYSVVLVIYL